LKTQLQTLRQFGNALMASISVGSIEASTVIWNANLSECKFFSAIGTGE